MPRQKRGRDLFDWLAWVEDVRKEEGRRLKKMACADLQRVLFTEENTVLSPKGKAFVCEHL